MSKVSRMCCIRNCNSKNPDPGPNGLTLFTVPTDPEQERQWFAAITPFLRKGKSSRKHFYVCELHFKSDDVLRTFRTTLVDGTLHSIPRKTFSLKPGSIPCIFECHQYDAITRQTIKNEQLENFDDVSMSNSNVINVGNMEYGNFNTNTISSNGPNFTHNSFTLEPKTEYPDVDVSSSDASNDSISSKSSTGHENLCGNVSSLRTSDHSYHMQPESMHIDDTCITSLVKKEHESLDTVDVSDVKLIETMYPQADAPLEVAPYNISKFIKDLETLGPAKMPNNWGIMKLPQAVLLQYFGDLTFYPTRFILILNDMTVEMRAQHDIAKVDILQRVTCIGDILSAMRIVGALKLCVGVGENTPCPKGFFKPLPYSRSDRCLDCRSERKKKIDKVGRRVKQYEAKKVKQNQRFVKNRNTND